LSLENDIERARLAEDVLKNHAYAESYVLIEKEFTKLWREARSKDEREDIHRALLMLDKARQVLESAMKSGQVAADKLRQKQSLAERLTGRLRN
jgi:hypothetical protein